MKKLLITIAIVVITGLLYWIFKININAGYIALTGLFIIFSIGSAIGEDKLENSRKRDNAMWKIQAQSWCIAGKIVFAFAAVFLIPWTLAAIMYFIHLLKQ